MTASPDLLFDAAVAIVLEEEGVFADQAGDPGGATVYGIARNDHLAIPWPPTRDQAIAIYRAGYWDAHRCGEMPWPWALAVFDGSVNQGGRVIGWAQQALRAESDGVVGAETLRLMRAAGAGDAFRRFLGARVKHYQLDKLYATDGNGWLARLFRVAQGGEHPPGSPSVA